MNTTIQTISPLRQRLLNDMRAQTLPKTQSGSASGQRNYRLPDRLDQNRSFPQHDSICSMKQGGLAASARNPPCAYSKGTISSATMLMILISGLTAGPAVSL